MFATAIDRIEARLAPHVRAISIAAVIWFWAAIALQSGFVDVPPIPWLPERAVFWAGAVFNALWWAWLYPEIQSRKKARAEPEPEPKPERES